MIVMVVAMMLRPGIRARGLVFAMAGAYHGTLQILILTPRRTVAEENGGNILGILIRILSPADGIPASLALPRWP